MKIIRQINNNAALALDGNGKELVVLGRGVGFPQMPYELTDLSRIERTFYDVNPKCFGMAADLPRPLVLACAEITERAEIELDCALNPNLPFTLADHLNFAAERLRRASRSRPRWLTMCATCTPRRQSWPNRHGSCWRGKPG